MSTIVPPPSDSQDANKRSREAISAGQRFEVLRRCNFCCYYCGSPASLGLKVLHVDHVVPVSLGGTNDPWNLVASCWDCNLGKSASVPPRELIQQVRDDWRTATDWNKTDRFFCSVCNALVPIDEGDELDDWRGLCNPCDNRRIDESEASWRQGYDLGFEAATKKFQDFVDTASSLGYFTWGGGDA